MNRWHRLQLAAESVASGLLLLALTVGVPILLVGLHGRPDHSRSFQRLVGLLDGRVTPAGILDFVVAAGWIAWLVVTITVLVELSAWTRGRPTPPLAIAAPIQPWVRHLVATTALIAGTFAPTLRTAGAVPIPAHTPAVSVSPAAVDVADRTMSIATAMTEQPVVNAAPVPSQASTCTVVPRNTLWGLAETHLRNPLRWREIFMLNQGIIQADGRSLDDPNLILPGWILQLPADADIPAAPTIVTPDAASASTSPADTLPPPAVTTSGDARRNADSAPAATPVQPTTTPTTRHTTGRPPPEPEDSRATQAEAHANSSESADLPVAAIAAGGLISLLTVVRLARRRRRQPPGPVSPSTRRVETQLRDLAATPTQAHVRIAMRALAPSFAHSGAQVLAMRVRHDERVEVLLDAALTQTPEGFEPSDDPRGWITRVDVTEASAAVTAATPAPCIVTIGEIDGETVLIDLETARLLTIGGDPALVTEWLHHAQVELATATPDDLVQVILIDDEAADPIIDRHPRLQVLTIDEALDELDAHTAGPEPAGDAGVTVLLSMCSLDDAVRTRIEVIAADPSRHVVAIVPSTEPATWHAHIEPDGLRLAPLGLVIDPCRIDAETTAAITELLDPPAAIVEPPPDEPSERAVTIVEDPPDLEIRVLGPVDVVGASQPFDRHKHLEIAVYLGLYPDGVSDERLKTALWPDRAPSTTTFNTAISTTRHRLGRDPAGDVFLSHYAAAGRRYRLNPRAGSDWARFQAHVARARHADREVTIDELRAGLDLVRGQPFAESYGFGWAWSEGHVASMEAAIADAAHRLAGAYLDQNEPDRAIWAAMRGLQAAPADEVLYRDRMLAYDLAGNPAGIATVMLELEHVVESIEPWDSIHPETIALYRRLTRSTAPGGRHRSRAPRRAD